ncbi:hypothetical protein LZQ00_15370 [Sphingobacterium sp. SRCM116780]|uniref:hypothetical protein n=1 Tax=Sphingobacterium sp. SRCM116780 TaxID=2907623 RepID=UPI001F3AAC66|nr:hypothetical protein [Sphingobacterium sp. SRCM116780]UIR55637.1 hypothetical protein LZQ00_15370 [Sphingobacterium sp. SRCM116780]
MKNLRIIFKITLFTLTMVIVSCTKGSDQPGEVVPPENSTVKVDDLLDYYIVSAQKTGATKLAVMSFEKDGDVVKASVHGRGYLRVKNIVVENSILSFDTEGFGSYQYTLEKDATGVLHLKSYSYTGNTTIDYAILAKKSTAFAFTNTTFKTKSGTEDLVFKFTNTNTLEWDIRVRQIGTKVINGQPIPIIGTGPDFTKPFYSLGTVGFKTNTDEFIGVAVPSWKDANVPLLLVENGASAIMKAEKQ